MMIMLEFPDETAGKEFKKLVDLHPGKTPLQVIVRALAAYHYLYDASLEDNDTPLTPNEILALLDSLEEQKRIIEEGK